jgi:O-antigen/teichoic acid export membrane protein
MLRHPMADESKEERLDRELIELLNELRVALPGVQVLFAFLLTVPFTSRFSRVNDVQQDAYLVALVATAIGSVLLIAPTSYHRIRFRDRDKEALILIANRLAIAGTVFLAVAMSASVFLVADVLYKATTTAVVTALVVGCFVWFWYGLPLLRELRERRASRSHSDT